MDISFFEGFTSKQPVPGTLDAIAILIKEDPKLESITRAYRQTGSASIKGESPLFAVAVTFEGGKSRANIKGITGLSLVDIDHVDNIDDIKRKAIADPHTLLCYTTISGKGLRIIFRYELHVGYILEQQTLFYPKAFAVGNEYYGKLLGVEVDTQCKNITRLSGLAFDPEVYLNERAVPFTAEQIETVCSLNVKENQEAKKMARIQSYYDAVIKPQLKKDGIVYAPGSHNDYVMRVGYKLAERRYSRQAAIKWAKSMFEEYDDVEQVFTSCFANANNAGNRDENRGESKFASVEEIKSFLDAHISLRFNEITSRVEYESMEDDAESTSPSSWLNINDRKVNSLWSDMSQAMRVNIQDIYRVIESDYVKPFNPFQDYLSQISSLADYANLAGRGGSPDYIKLLASTVRVKGGEEQQQLWYKYLKKWLVAMVASWIDDTVVNNVILVLIGEQGAYKTTWFNYLMPPELSQYFYTKTNANRMTKDDLLTLAQYGLVCCEELDTMRPAELNQLKAAVTMPSIDERAAYAHFHEHRKHIASFCGTGNNVQFLSDPTGNRRWLPFEIEHILSPREHPFPYEGIYAQALALYKQGFQYWFSKEEIQELNRHNQQFETPHLERELVALYFRVPQSGENGIFMSSARALQIVGSGIAQKLNSIRLGQAFSELGFTRVRYRGARGFLVIQRSAEDIQAYQKGIVLDQNDMDDQPL